MKKPRAHTDREAENAAHALFAYASDVAIGLDETPEHFCEMFDELTERERGLAHAALMTVPAFDRVTAAQLPWHEQVAEASSWLMSGWRKPGDEGEWLIAPVEHPQCRCSGDAFAPTPEQKTAIEQAVPVPAAVTPPEVLQAANADLVAAKAATTLSAEDREADKLLEYW